MRYCIKFTAKLPLNVEQGTTSLNVGNTAELPSGAPRWAALLGTPTAAEGDRPFLKKGLAKGSASGQLPESLCCRNTNGIVWVNADSSCESRSKASLTTAMGEQTLLGWGDRGACYEDVWSLSQDRCCPSQLMLPVVARTLLWAKYRQNWAWSSAGIGRGDVTGGTQGTSAIESLPHHKIS